jgi:galactonate dehydratase
MRIADIVTIKVPPSWVWVKVLTDEGLTGWGEPYLECHGDTIIAEVERIKPFLLGKDPTAVEQRWQDMYTCGTGYVGGPVKMSAISGIDMALWDIKGKAAGLPIFRLLGGPARDGILMYHSYGFGEPRFVEPGDPYRAIYRDKPRKPPSEISRDERLDAIATAARGYREWGYRCLKMHVNIRQDFTGQGAIGAIAENVAAARAAMGSEALLAIDVHNPQPQMALKLAHKIERYDMLFMEEPVSVERIEDLAIVAGRTTIPIAAGERWMGKWDFRRALDAGARVLQPDIAHAGGITELKKIAAIAECYNAYMAPHCPLSIMSMAASFQLGMGIPNLLVQEHNEVNDYRLDGKTLYGYGYLKTPYVLDGDGMIRLSEAPGLGIEIDEESLDEIIKTKEWTVARG